MGCGSSIGQPDTVSRAEFEQIFPGHSAFYNYDGFAAHTHFDSRKDAAQFLANVAHETAGLTRVEEEVTAARSIATSPWRTAVPRVRTATSAEARCS